MENKTKNKEVSKVKDFFGINKRKITAEKVLKEIDKLFDF